MIVQMNVGAQFNVNAYCTENRVFTLPATMDSVNKNKALA
jgi:hypothetical protein